jgi:malic enzyme
MFIFPGVGLGATLVDALRVTDRMFYAAAEALARCVDIDNEKGLVFPPVKDIREVTAKVASAVINLAIEEKIATNAEAIARNGEPGEEFVRSRMYEPKYAPLVYTTKRSSETKTWY